MVYIICDAGTRNGILFVMYWRNQASNDLGFHVRIDFITEQVGGESSMFDIT